MNKKLLLHSFFMWCFIAITVFAQTGSDWKWVHPSPQGNTLRGVQMITPTTWYAIGLAGTFMKTTNAGASWDFVVNIGKPQGTSGQGSALYDMHFFDANNGVAVGANNSILKTTDAGATWTVSTIAPAPTSATTIFYQVTFINSQVGYVAGTSTPKIFKTTDGGSTWNSVPGYTSTVTAYDVWSPNDTLIIVATTSGNVQRSTDGGATFATVATGASFSVYKMEGVASAVMAVGTVGNARISTDGGATWAAASTGLPTTNTHWELDYLNGNFYITGSSFNVYKTSNNGVSWDTLALLNPAQPWTSTMYASAFTSTGDTVVTVGAFGLVQSRFGASATPTAHTYLGKPGTWNDVWSSSPTGTVIAVGAPTSAGNSADQVARSTDGGTNWSVLPWPNKVSAMWSIDMVDNNTGYMSGTNSSVYKTTNGGATWDSLVAVGLPTGATFRKIDFVDVNTGWVFASAPSTLANFIFKTTDGGLNWVAQSHGLTATSAGQVYGSHMRDANKGTIVTWEPRPYSTTDGGSTWRRDSTIDAYTGFLYDVRMVDDNLGYMVGGSGRIYKTTNGGVMWDTLSKPTGSTYTHYTLEVYNASIFAVFGSTGVFYITYDGGLNWTMKNTGGATLNGSSLSFGQNNSSAFFTVGTNGYILKNTLTPVPVELTSFGASVVDGNVRLSWKTSTELNNSGFEIERKSANGSWTKIGFIAGAGTSASGKEYAYTDKSVNSGKFSYRLRQVDFDGTATYSGVVEVDLTSPFTFALDQNYPNPFNPATSVKFQVAEKTLVTLKVYDVIGNEVATLVNKEQETGSYIVKFDASKYASGMYIYKLTAGKFEKTMKMMLLK